MHRIKAADYVGWVHGRRQVANHDIRVEEMCRGNGWMVGRGGLRPARTLPPAVAFSAGTGLLGDIGAVVGEVI